MPVLGLGLGAIYMPQNNEENKKFGKYCLIIAAVGVVISILFFIMMIAMGAMFEGAMSPGYDIQEGYY